MARPEVTGKRIGTPPVKPKRSAGPPTAADDVIEPSDQAGEAPSPVSDAHCVRAPPPPDITADSSAPPAPETVEPSDDTEATPGSEVKKKKKKRPQVKLVRVLEAPLAFSVEEFCLAHNISVGFFYELLKRGEAPDIMKLGIRTLISHEAAARWRAERTAASSNTAVMAAIVNTESK